MITNNEKEEICKKHETYIKLIYYFGKGVMMSVHIQRYMEKLESKSKSQVWRDLRELQNNDIVDIHKVHNNNYIKLKKYALKFLLFKDSTKNIKAVNYGYTAIKKSAFINEFILKYKLKGSYIDEIIEYYSNHTTLINRDKQNTAILKNYKDKNESILNEIEKLDSIWEKQIQNLINAIHNANKAEDMKTRLNRIKNKKNKEKSKSVDFSLNNMQSRNVFISSIKENIINVIFFDIFDNLTLDKIGELFENVYLYLSDFFSDKTFRFTIVASDEYHYNRISRLHEPLEKVLQSKHLLGCFYIGIVNLEIRSKVFSNINIIL